MSRANGAFDFQTREDWNIFRRTSVLGEVDDQASPPSLSALLGENRAAPRPLSLALVFLVDSAADSGELQVLRLKISGELVKNPRQQLPPMVDEKRAVDIPSGVFSVILEGGRWWLSLGAKR